MWYANYQFGGKQHRPSLETTSKKQARRLALQIEVKLAAGTWNPAPAVATVAEAVAAYLDFLRAEERAPKTLSRYEKVFERVAALAAERRVRDLSGIDLAFVDAYRRRRTDDGAAAKTKYTEAVIIRQLVTFALSRNMLAADPLRGLKLKKPKPPARAVLDALPRRCRWVVTMPPPRCPEPGRQWTERRLLGVLKTSLAGLGLPGKRHAFISNAPLTGTAVAVAREWVGHVGQQVIDLYTHVHNDASQAAMQRLADANRQLQTKEKARDGTDAGPAQTQHTERAVDGASDAK